MFDWKNDKASNPINKLIKCWFRVNKEKVKTIKEKTAANNPQRIPWNKNGPRINPLVAPTNRIISISSSEKRYFNLKVLNVTITAIKTKKIVKVIPILLNILC